MRTPVAEMPAATSQRGVYGWWRDEAHKATAAALATLLQRSGRVPLDRASLGHGDAVADVGDAEAVAQLAEVVVMLAAEVDELKAASAAKNGGNR